MTSQTIYELFRKDRMSRGSNLALEASQTSPVSTARLSEKLGVARCQKQFPFWREFRARNKPYPYIFDPLHFFFKAVRFCGPTPEDLFSFILLLFLLMRPFVNSENVP
jgi:hypothetical protein